MRVGSLNEKLKILKEVRVNSEFDGKETDDEFKCYIRAHHNIKEGNYSIINNQIVFFKCQKEP